MTPPNVTAKDIRSAIPDAIREALRDPTITPLRYKALAELYRRFNLKPDLPDVSV